jgi:hypothetical protein
MPGWLQKDWGRGCSVSMWSSGQTLRKNNTVLQFHVGFEDLTYPGWVGIYSLKVRTVSWPACAMYSLISPLSYFWAWLLVRQLPQLIVLNLNAALFQSQKPFHISGSEGHPTPRSWLMHAQINSEHIRRMPLRRCIVPRPRFATVFSFWRGTVARQA